MEGEEKGIPTCISNETIGSEEETKIPNSIEEPKKSSKHEMPLLILFKNMYPEVYKFLIRWGPPVIIVWITCALLITFIYIVIIPLWTHGHSFIVFSLFGIFTFFFILWMSCFISLLTEDPGSMEKEMEMTPNYSCSTHCIYCKCYKPYRTHHCKRCGKCFAHLDHHCDALGICIGLRNHKYFILFLFYSILIIFIGCAICLIAALILPTDGFPICITILIAAASFLAVMLSVLLIQQVFRICSGRTTFEYIFNINVPTKATKLENFEVIFGPRTNPLRWFFPEPTPYTWTSAFDWEKDRPTKNVTQIKID